MSTLEIAGKNYSTMYDAETISDAIPADAGIVAYYNDGEAGSETEEAVKALFPNAVLVSITRTGENAAKVIDYEAGAATLEAVVKFIDDGLGDTVYCTESSLPAVAGALSDPTPRAYNLWIPNPVPPDSMASALDQFSKYPNCIAVQIVWNGEQYNESILRPGTPWPASAGAAIPPDDPPAVDTDELKEELPLVEEEGLDAEGHTIHYPMVDALSVTNPEGTVIGYYFLDSAGQVYAIGGVPYRGNAPSDLKSEAVAIQGNAEGYAIFCGDGAVYTFGDFPFHGVA